MMPFATHIRSGETPSCSQANIRPVRPKPVATSSQISSTSWRSHSSRTAAQVARRVHEHPGRALHERLHDHRRHLAARTARAAASMSGGRRARPGACRTAAAGTRSGTGRCRRPTPSRSCRRGRPSAARRTSSPLLAALAPVLEGHLERDLGGGRAVVRVEDPRQPGRRELHQPPRQLDAGTVATGRASSSARRGPSWSRTAASMRGWPCPCTLHHSDETPSM